MVNKNGNKPCTACKKSSCFRQKMFQRNGTKSGEKDKWYKCEEKNES